MFALKSQFGGHSLAARLRQHLSVLEYSLAFTAWFVSALGLRKAKKLQQRQQPLRLSCQLVQCSNSCLVQTQTTTANVFTVAKLCVRDGEGERLYSYSLNWNLYIYFLSFSQLYRSSSFNSSGRSSNCDTTEDMYSDISLENRHDYDYRVSTSKHISYLPELTLPKYSFCAISLISIEFYLQFLSFAT